MQGLIGRRIAHYQVEKLLHRGLTMVCLARDLRDNRQIALKILPPEAYSDKTKVETFWREGVKGMTELRHAHIVPVYDMGASDGYYYIAMRFIAGGSLEDLLRQRGALPPELAVPICRQVAEALAFAHQKGVIHRDVKPGNILISNDRTTAYLADFGIAKLTGQQTITEHGSVIGTPEYMSPEQIQGSTVDGRADIYSLGITLYFMLTGAQPFTGEPAAVLYHQVHTVAKPPRQLNSEIPTWLEKVVKRAMVKRPEQRYQNAAQMAAALNRAESVPARRRTLTLAAAVALVAALILLLALFFPGGRIIAGDSTPTATTVAITMEDLTATLVPAGSGTATLAPEVTEETAEATTPPVSTTDPESVVTPASRAPTRVGVTPNVTASPDGSGTPLPTLAPLVLLSPGAGSRLSTGSGETTFSWQWGGALIGDQHFQLRFYNVGGSREEAPFGPVKQARQSVNLDNLDYRGDLEWAVALIVFRNGEVVEVLAESPRRPLRLDGR